MDPGFKPLYRTITNYGFALTCATASSFVFGFLMLGDLSRVSRWGWVTLAAFLSLSVGAQVGTYIVHR